MLCYTELCRMTRFNINSYAYAQTFKEVMNACAELEEDINLLSEW